MRPQWIALGVLVRARLAETTRTPVAFVLTFVFPAILLLSLGLVFYQGHPFERRPVAVVCAQPEPIQQQLINYHSSMSLQTLSESQAQQALKQAHIEAYVRCLDTANTGSPSARSYEIVHSPAGQLTAIALQLLLQRSNVERTVTLRVASNVQGAYVAGLFPATLAFTVLFAGLYGLGPPMLRYRRKNILAKFALTPLSLSSLIFSQILARVLLSLGQCAVLFAVGIFFWHGLTPTLLSLIALAIVVLTGTIAFCALGFLFAAGVATEDTLSDLMASSATPLVLLSGAFFPVSELPSWLAAFARWLPSTQLVEGCRLALAQEFQALLLPVGSLTLWSIAALWLGVKFFKVTPY